MPPSGWQRLSAGRSRDCRTCGHVLRETEIFQLRARWPWAGELLDLDSEEPLQLAHWYEPSASEPHGTKASLIEQLVDGVVADPQVSRCVPWRYGQRNEDCSAYF